MSGPIAAPANTPRSGITGWGAARKELERVKNPERREVLEALACSAGVQGAPAMEFVAKLLRWLADDGQAPVPPAKLRQHEVAYCERRARELLRPFLEAGDRRMSDGALRRARKRV